MAAGQRSRAMVAATVVALAVALAGCGDDGGGDSASAPDLTGVDVTVGWVGSGDVDELVGELYAEVLEARGAAVERRPGLADRQDALEQLASGAVTVVPERSHALLAELTAPADPEARTVAEQLAALREALPAGVTVLTPSTAHTNEVVACREAVVEELELHDQADLQQVRADRPGELHEDDCRTVAASDPVIDQDGLVALVDDGLDTPVDAVTPLVNAGAATPELQATLDALSSTLGPMTLPMLLARVGSEGDELRAVAADWLEAVDIT